ncbi:Predicted arabinose efflux permease, MFS family [Roseomonas rosea]|uniref:Predicted arabinose efflux permease, MFS family n=1 Tax=Muricoccus roseus TaxID=198092 RepID=A0A1M6QD98_9PROT|nr:MFS transporter [Roseomonas rosea]SHK18145.1 Predicted arabinose efflux permease, MFS family [Roseomonas rosea]
MPAPAAFIPFRNPAFRMLWTATLISNIGGWVQSTGAGWLMTSLSPSPVMVSLVQVASMLPVFLLALPAGALADIMDRRRFLIFTQVWICAAALLLCALTAAGLLGPWGLLAFTFLIGIGAAANFPAFGATTPELVVREDLVQAIVLNAMGFNLSRAIGPALGGIVLGWAGAEVAFALNAACYLYLTGALLLWKRSPEAETTPREGLLDAMGSGVRYVLASPVMRGIIIRATLLFFAGSAVWGLLPILVRFRLGLGPYAFGLMLGAMGAGAVMASFGLPALRSRISRSNIVLLCACGMGLAIIALGLSPHWLPAGLAMLVYGASWLGMTSTLSAASQLAARPWVRARAIGLFQVATFGAMVLGSTLGGVGGALIGVPHTLVVFGLGAILLGILSRRLPLEPAANIPIPARLSEPVPEAPAPEILRSLTEEARLLESVRYAVPTASRDAFLAAMAEVRGVRLRAGAIVWRLYEDLAHPERYIELWAVRSWSDHLREQSRLSEQDHAILAAAAAFQQEGTAPEAERFVQLPI